MYYRVRVKEGCVLSDLEGYSLVGRVLTGVYLQNDLGFICIYPSRDYKITETSAILPEYVEILEELKLVTKSSVCNQEISAHISSYGEVTHKNNAIKDIFGHNISKITVEYAEPK
jgi:hypothetical protein